MTPKSLWQIICNPLAAFRRPETPNEFTVTGTKEQWDATSLIPVLDPPGRTPEGHLHARVGEPPRGWRYPTNEDIADALNLRRVVLVDSPITDPTLDIPAKPLTKSEKLTEIARLRNETKDLIAKAVKQKKPRNHLRVRLAKLTRLELEVEGSRETLFAAGVK